MHPSGHELKLLLLRKYIVLTSVSQQLPDKLVITFLGSDVPAIRDTLFRTTAHSPVDPMVKSAVFWCQKMDDFTPPLDPCNQGTA